MKNYQPFTRKLSCSAVVAAIALLVAGCGGNEPATQPKTSTTKEQGGPKLAVSTVTASKIDWVNQVTVDVDVVSLASPNIAAEVAGKVSNVEVLPGQAVKKGQVLATISPTDLALSAADASAQAAQIAAQLADKERNLKRNEELAAKEYIGRASLEASQTEVAALRQQLRAFQAREALAQGNLAKSKIVAPFDGVVTQRNVAAGSYVRAGDVLMTMWSPASSTLRLRVPQEYAGKVSAGQKLTLKWAGKDVQTALTRVRTDINAESRSFEAQAAVPQELQAVTGAAFSAQLELGREQVIAVPALAVQLNGTTYTVFTIDAAGKAQQKTVTTNRQMNGLVEVVSGLSGGEKVIVDGASFARDGQPVTEKDSSSKEGAAQ